MSLKLRLWTMGLLLLSMLLVWGLQSELFPSATPDPKLNATEPAAGGEAARDVINSQFPAQGKTYPYSVIPGGVASVEELKDAIDDDSTVARHLENFNLKEAKLVEVAAARSVYVSYRKGTQIYWTTRPLKLAKGEKLITDGNRTLRSRCGNDVSDFPQEPTSREEPTDTELDTPLPALETQNWELSDPLIVPSETNTVDKGFSSFPPFIGIPPGGGSAPPSSPPVFFPGGGTPTSTPQSPPIPTPEPSSLILILLGAAGIGVERIRRLRK